MSTHSAVYFFGYGSLVNRDTHTFKDTSPARLNGWQRVWIASNLREVALLSAIRREGSWIDGLIAPVPDGDWQALDIREGAYQRISATSMITHHLPNAPQIAVYSVPEDLRCATTSNHHLLLSYIDVVVQGYLREYGLEGAQHFFETTDGWNMPVLDDRAAPIYPRACRLSRKETAVVDAGLARLSVEIYRA